MESERKQQHPPAAGEPAPDFTLLDTDDDWHTLSAAVREHPLVVVFYRGDW